MSGRPHHSSTADLMPEEDATTAIPPGAAGTPRRRRRSILALGTAVAAAAAAVALIATSLGGGAATTVIHEPGGLTVRETPIGDGAAHLVATVTGPPPVPATAAAAAVAASESEFGLALTRRLIAETPGQNVIDSPLSADLALSMLELGAEGATRQGIAATLQAPSVSASELASAWARIDAVSGAGGPLELADSAWLQRHVSFVPSYLAELARSYGDDAYSADFAGDNPGATAAINRWVTAHTGGSIRTLFPPGSLDPSTILVLANALNFTARWAASLAMSDTTDAFVSAGGRRVAVPAIENDPSGLELRAAVNSADTAVEIPYQGGRYQAVVIEPPAGTIERFVGDLDASRLDRILASLHSESVALTMPTLDLGASQSLDAALSAMGMAAAFRPGADLSGISPQAGYVGVVRQADRLVVNKRGTHFAAATGVSVVASAARVNVAITVDRPYLFLIRDRVTGLIVADAVVDNPAG
jgi:serpin B